MSVRCQRVMMCQMSVWLQVPLTPEDGTHTVHLSPSGDYCVDSCSQAARPPVLTLRDGHSGAVLMTLETMDISKLLASGWRPPTQVTTCSILIIYYVCWPVVVKGQAA
jgi:hypothetical protein